MSKNISFDIDKKYYEEVLLELKKVPYKKISKYLQKKNLPCLDYAICEFLKKINEQIELPFGVNPSISTYEKK